MPTTAWSGDGRRGYGYGYGSGGLPGSQRDLKVGNLMIGKSPAGDYGEEVSHDLRRAQVQPKTQVKLEGFYLEAPPPFRGAPDKLQSWGWRG